MTSAAAARDDAGVSSGSAVVKLEPKLTRDTFRKTDSIIQLQMRLSDIPGHSRLSHLLKKSYKLADCSYDNSDKKVDHSFLTLLPPMGFLRRSEKLCNCLSENPTRSENESLELISRLG